MTAYTPGPHEISPSGLSVWTSEGIPLADFWTALPPSNGAWPGISAAEARANAVLFSQADPMCEALETIAARLGRLLEDWDDPAASVDPARVRADLVATIMLAIERAADARGEALPAPAGETAS